jgi:hypothetical protein
MFAFSVARIPLALRNATMRLVVIAAERPQLRSRW